MWYNQTVIPITLLFMKRSIKIMLGIILGLIVVFGIVLAANGDFLQGRLPLRSKSLPAYDETKIKKPKRDQKGLPAYDEKKYEQYNSQFADGIFLITSKKCDNENVSYCCGNGIWDHGLESYATCPEDIGTYFESAGRPIEKSTDNGKVSIICIYPCPYSDEVFGKYAKKYIDLYDKMTAFTGHFPPLFEDDFYNSGYEKLFNTDKTPPITLILGDSNYSNSGFYLMGTTGGEYVVNMGCPTGLCYPDQEDYVYLNSIDTIFYKLDYQGQPYQQYESPHIEVHETLHNSIPTAYCSDWDHGVIMFLDNIITNGELIYEQYFDVMNYMYENKISFSELPEEYMEKIHNAAGSDYARAVGYIFLGGLHEYYGCDENCVKGIVYNWIEGLNNSNKNVCYGGGLIEIINNHTPQDASEWIELMGLTTGDGLDIFK